MTNAWNVTEAEYREALELSRDGNTSPEHSAVYWQLCRFYRGQIFLRDQAALAVRLIRGLEEPSEPENYNTDPLYGQRMDSADMGSAEP
jgi:hypothetical protein